MKKIPFRIFLGIALAGACAATVRAGSVTVDFTALGFTTSLATLNQELAGCDVTVDAGLPGTLVAGGGDNLQANTYAPASDLLFNFSSPVSSISLTTGGSGNAVGATGFNINTTAADGPGLPGPDVIAYEGGVEGETLTLTQDGIEAVQFEDEGAIASISSMTYALEPVPEPATGVFLGVGAVALAGFRLRRWAR